MLRLDLADLPSLAQLSVAYQAGTRARVTLRVRDATVDLSAVTAVWSRRPQAPSPDAEITNQALRDYVRQETADAWIGASTLLDCPWLPAPRWQELRACYKALQLQVAADLGFEIPPTLVTNSSEDFLDFYRRHNGAVVSKTVHNRLLPVDRPEGYDAYVLTEPVANRDVVDADAVRYCPVTVQPYVDKRVELRVTVVGDRVFPVEVDSQWTNHTRYDWRRGDCHRGRYAIHDLPPIVGRRCVALVERLGLRFGAIDLILTPDGRYVFLEINPNGSWLATEQLTGLPISAAIGDLLMAGEAPASPTRVTPDLGPTASRQPHTGSEAPALARTPGPKSRTPARIPQAAIAATLKYLGQLAHAGTGPDEATAGLRRLAKRHRGISMDLVWEVESCLGAIHYDALLRIPGGGTLSLAFSPQGSGVPWALRHAHHARETDLLQVNGRILNMQTVMGYLDGLWYDARLLTGLVDGCLVREAVDARGIKATDGELRRAVDAFERKAGLASFEARDAWLQARGWTRDDLDYEIGRQVVAFKLRKQIASGKIDAYFARHRTELSMAVIARVRVADREAARDVARKIKRNVRGFCQAIEEALTVGEAISAKSELTTVRRRDLPPAYAEAIFAASPGQVLGPLECADGHYDVVRVLRTVPGRLDDPTRELVTWLLFEEWLAERRGRAVVDWFWGDADRALAARGHSRGRDEGRTSP